MASVEADNETGALLDFLGHDGGGCCCRVSGLASCEIVVGRILRLLVRDYMDENFAGCG